MRRHKRRENPERIIWHYSIGDHLPSLIASGVIRRATFGVEPPEKPVTWFSLNPTWEVMASKAPIFSDVPAKVRMDWTHDNRGGLVRIGVELRHAPFGIYELHRVARCRRKEVDDLVRIGIRDGASPSEWRFTPDEVPAELWKCIEIWDGEGQWVPYNGYLAESCPVLVGSEIG